MALFTQGKIKGKVIRGIDASEFNLETFTMPHRAVRIAPGLYWVFVESKRYNELFPQNTEGHADEEGYGDEDE